MIERYLNDPLVAPLWALAALSLAVFVLTVWRAIEAGAFDLAKLPRLLDTLVLRRLVPLALLGATAYAVTDPTTKDALIVAYSGGVVAAAAAEAMQLLDAVLGRTFPDIPMSDTTPPAVDSAG